jgi:5-methylcytosine-specific restriction endonuclease McrBC regulatory subunit McrC
MISARHVTGFVQVGNIYVEVRPKFLDSNRFDEASWRTALINLVLLAIEDLPIDGTTSASVHKNLPVPDLLAESFIRAILCGSQRGLPRGYRETNESLPFVSGRLDFRRAIDLFRAPPKVPVVRDELTEDITVNRLLKWAASTLAAMVVSSRRAGMLKELAFGFNCNSVRCSIIEARRVTVGPQHKPLTAAIQVARVLLENSNLLHAGEGPEIPGLLWNSADIFERLVFRVVRRSVASRNLRALKTRERFADPVSVGSTLHMTPDIQIRWRNVPQTLLDAKYKTFDRVPLTSDVYQVIAAGKALECDNVGIVYPGSGVSVWEWQLRGAGRPHTLRAITLDLSVLATPVGLRELGNAMWEFLQPMLPAPVALVAS